MALPAKIRANMAVPFPAMVQGSGPITLGKQNGVWTVGASGDLIGEANPGAIATDFVLVWDSAAKGWIKVALSNLTRPLSVAAFGAKGDGVKDDTAALNAAFAFGSNNKVA